MRERTSQSDPLQAWIEGEHLAHLEGRLVEACGDNWRLKELLTAEEASQPELQGPRKCHAKLHLEAVHFATCKLRPCGITKAGQEFPALRRTAGRPRTSAACSATMQCETGNGHRPRRQRTGGPRTFL